MTLTVLRTAVTSGSRKTWQSDSFRPFRSEGIADKDLEEEAIPC